MVSYHNNKSVNSKVLDEYIWCLVQPVEKSLSTKTSRMVYFHFLCFNCFCFFNSERKSYICVRLQCIERTEMFLWERLSVIIQALGCCFAQTFGDTGSTLERWTSAVESDETETLCVPKTITEDESLDMLMIRHVDFCMWRITRSERSRPIQEKTQDLYFRKIFFRCFVTWQHRGSMYIWITILFES